MVGTDSGEKQSSPIPSLPHRVTKTSAHISRIVSAPCFSPYFSSLSLSRVSWPAAVAASRRALLMMVLKESENDRERERKRMWQTAFCSPTPTDTELWQKKEKKEKDSKRQCSFSEQSVCF